VKIRTGFVSNSSSSSFCIAGIYLENWDDELDEKAQEEGLFTTSGESGDVMYIGLDFSDMEYDETKREFYKRVEEKLKKIGIEESASYYCEGWYNG